MKPYAPLYTSLDLATVLGARFVESMPDDTRPTHVKRFWRCAVDKLHRTDSESIPILCAGGSVMAWPRVPDPIIPGGEHA